jgi:hypothetical protein
VAKKKKRKIGWLRKLLFFIFTPLLIWFLAFLIWFYWNDITGLSRRHNKTPGTRAEKPFDRPSKQSEKTNQERIGEEDRRKLEDILKSKK